MTNAPTHVRSAPGSIPAILAALTAVILGAFMAILDVTIVNVALPTFGRVFASDLHALQWVITGYMLAQAGVIPLSGWLSDRFGSKQVYLVALVLFTAGSALCAAATSTTTLVLFRVIQGLGGGMLMPVGMAILYRVAPPEQRGAVMGIFGIPMLLGPALGPVLSGWLLEYASWQWIFLINVPVGAFAVLIGLRSLPALASDRPVAGLDVPGIVLGPVAFSALTYGISQSTEAGWTGQSTLVGISIGLAGLLAFVARELTTEHPLLELRVFRSRDFALAILAQWSVVAGLFGTMFLIPLFLQQVRGYSPFETGIISLPNALVAACTMPIAGRIFDRVGARPPVLVGLGIVAFSFWLMTGLSASTTGWDLVIPLGLMGGGMGLVMMPLGTHVLNSAPRHLVSRVTSLTGSCQSVVAALAIATFATLLGAQVSSHAAEGLAPQAAQAAAFGDVYRTALVMLVVAAGVTGLLRRSNTPAGAGQPASDVVPSAT